MMALCKIPSDKSKEGYTKFMDELGKPMTFFGLSINNCEF